MSMLTVLFAICFTALIGIFYSLLLPWIFLISLGLIVYFGWQYRQKRFNPQSDTYKTLEKIKKKRQKVENNKHKHINDQIRYIGEMWGYTKEQEKMIDRFIESRSYGEMYNRLTASLFPQMITLIENCNARDKKGCKREVSKRLRKLILLMKEEMKKKKLHHMESFETTLEVYDQLLLGIQKD